MISSGPFLLKDLALFGCFVYCVSLPLPLWPGVVYICTGLCVSGSWIVVFQIFVNFDITDTHVTTKVLHAIQNSPFPKQKTCEISKIQGFNYAEIICAHKELFSGSAEIR